MTINEAQDEIIGEFEVFEDWMDRYQLIIDYGRGLPVMPEEDKNDRNLIDGCQSKVWFTVKVEDGKLFFTGASDAICISLTVSVYASTSARRAVTAWRLCSNR